MKKWPIPLLALFLTACAFTPFLWQQEGGSVSDAQIDKMGEDRYYVTTKNWAELEVFELNAAGEVHHLSSIPLEGYSKLNIHWLDDFTFFSESPHGALALISIHDGVLWTVEEEQLKSLIGLEEEETLTSSYNLHVNDDGTAFLLGSIMLKTYKRHGFIAQVSQMGEITSITTQNDASSVSLIQFFDDGYLLQWLIRPDAGAYQRTLQKRNWNDEIVFEHNMDLSQSVALATTEKYFLIDVYNENPRVTAYDWNQQELFQFALSDNIPSKYNTKVQLSGDDNLLIYNSSNGIEKRSTTDGSLIWTKPFDKATDENDIRISGSGIYSRIVTDFKGSVSGVTFKIDRDEEGNVLFSGNKTFNSEHLISYEVGDLETSTVKTITQQGVVIHYDFEHCLFGGYGISETTPNSGGCQPETEVEKQGSIEVFDYELLEDGGLITLTNLAVNPDDPENGDTYLNKFLVTRYK